MASQRRRRGTRGRIFRGLGWLLSGLVALIVAEVVLRLGGLAPTGGLATVTQSEFERLPGLFSPGQRLEDRVVPSLPYQVTIDSLGYRGTVEFPRTKPPGEFRILMLGDSFTFGYLVPDDSTLPALVGTALRQDCRAPIRVINAGVGGTTIVTASHLAQRAEPLGIDIAVLTFTENDVGDLLNPLWYQMEANRKAKSRLPLSLLYPVARQTALWNLLLKARATWAARRSPVMAAAATPGRATDSLVAALRGRYAEDLRSLRDSLSVKGIPLLFVVYPSHLTVYKRSTGEQVNWAVGVGHQVGLPTVDLTEVLREDGRGEEALYLLPVDGHPSAAGYRAVAPTIAGGIGGLLDGPAGCTRQ